MFATTHMLMRLLNVTRAKCFSQKEFARVTNEQRIYAALLKSFVQEAAADSKPFGLSLRGFRRR